MPELFDEADVVATLRDGRVVAYAKRNVGTVGPGTVSLDVQVPDLKAIEYVLNVQFHVEPLVDIGNVVNQTITGNVVGMTLHNVSAGTTLTAEVVAVGSP